MFFICDMSECLYTYVRISILFEMYSYCIICIYVNRIRRLLLGVRYAVFIKTYLTAIANSYNMTVETHM